jgi:IMP dehydrogenase
VVDERHHPIGLVTEADLSGVDRFTQVRDVMSRDVVTIGADESAEDAFSRLSTPGTGSPRRWTRTAGWWGSSPVRAPCERRSTRPNVDEHDPASRRGGRRHQRRRRRRAKELAAAGIDLLVVRYRTRHQEKMLETLRAVRDLGLEIPTARVMSLRQRGCSGSCVEAVCGHREVGVGPGAMCTTRMMTAVGRPQFSAVLECSTAARELGAHVWADGGVRHPRDVALAPGPPARRTS